MKKRVTVLLLFCALSVYAQKEPVKNTESDVKYKYRVSFPIGNLPQFFTSSWNDRQNTQHFELHLKRNLDDKNIIGIKLATWRLFQPMGIVWWDGLLDKLKTESEFYPGYVRHTGIGFSYQRMLWKGLFTTVEVLPQYKTYLDEDNNKIKNGFQVYTSLHLGYHMAFGKKKRFFIEPQVHSQFWTLSTKAPESFKALDDKWRKYFLFEPSIFVGIKF